MRALLTFTITSFSAFTIATMPVLASETRELDSHEHGHVKLEVAVDGNKMEIGLEAPGESIVGFEHAAKTDEQKAAVSMARKKLSDAGAVFVLPVEAGCIAQSGKIELHQHGDHNEFEGKYEFTCTNVAALTSLETNLFKLFPSIDEIDADYVSANGQGSVELEADAPRITFKPAS